METSPSISIEPISNSARRGGPGLALFGSIFAIMGFAALIPVFLLPMFHIIEAQGWRSVPCTILHSQVLSHSTSRGGGPTYSIKISYKYTFDNVQHVGTRYDFSLGSSGGLEYRRAIVRRLHAGVHTTCYVNSTDPSESVIDRGMFRDMWYSLVALLFLTIGVSIVVFAVRNAHPKPVSSGSAGTATRANPSQLKESQSPLTKLTVIGLMALFWNGIVSIFVRQAYFSSSGPTDWFGRIFLVPFLIIGVLFVVGWFHQMLAVFNPRPHLTLTNPAIALGEGSEVRWSFTGNYSRISRLTIRIEGRESATYQRHSSSRNGDSSVTNTSTFAQLPITDTTRKMEIGNGRGSFTIPADSMHSFASRNNKITWSIILHGEISGWPDVKTEFPFNVAPMAIKPVYV